MSTNEMMKQELMMYREAIPPACFNKSNFWAWWGVVKSTFIMASGFVLISFYTDNWMVLLPGWILAGIGFAGYWALSHDCLHYCLFDSKKMNRIFGHFLLIPTLYPFESFKQGHTDHHQHTNHIYEDSVWRPDTYDQFQKESPLYRAIYKWIRGYGWWFGTFFHIFPKHYQIAPEGQIRKATIERKRSLIFSYSILVLLIVFAVTKPGLFLIYYLAPWIVFSFILSSISLLQHSLTLGTDKKTLTWREEGPAEKPIWELTVDVRLPPLLGSMIHQAQIHIVHHYFPGIPSYHLARANEAIRNRAVGVPWREIGLNYKSINLTINNSQLFSPSTKQLVSFKTVQSGT